MEALLLPLGGRGAPRIRWEEDTTSSSDEYEEDGDEDGVFRWKDDDGADGERENSVSRSDVGVLGEAKDRATCALPKLHSLDLSHCEAVTSQGIITVASTLRDKLQVLNLTRCRKVGRDGLEAVSAVGVFLVRPAVRVSGGRVCLIFHVKISELLLAVVPTPFLVQRGWPGAIIFG